METITQASINAMQASNALCFNGNMGAALMQDSVLAGYLPVEAELVGDK